MYRALSRRAGTASGGAAAPRARAYSLLRGRVVVGHEAKAVQHGRQLLPLLDRERAQLVCSAQDKQPPWPLACPAPADPWPTRTAASYGGPTLTPLPRSPPGHQVTFPGNNSALGYREWPALGQGHSRSRGGAARSTGWLLGPVPAQTPSPLPLLVDTSFLHHPN